METELSDNILCDCKPLGLSCAIRAVKKNGDNFGRRFLCCQKPKTKSCSFFRWEDESKNVTNHKRKEPENDNAPASPTKKTKFEKDPSLEPASKSFREMALELVYQRLVKAEETMTEQQKNTLQIAEFLKVTSENLKDVTENLKTICKASKESKMQVESTNPFEKTF